MKILMVTRESHADKRYGLGKSLTPIIVELERRGHTVGYLCQADAGARSINAMRTLHGWLVKLCGRYFTHTEFVPLLWGILERLNMGRLAAKVMARDGYTHVHCHDPMIAAGYRWWARWRWLLQLRRGHTARWGVTEHGFGCYTQAFHEDGARLGTATTRWLRRWEAKILLKAHWVLTPTHSGLAQLGRDLGIYPIPSTWYAIHHARPCLNQYPRDTARQHLGWTQDNLYIIAVGRFAELKQMPALIQACAQLPSRQWRLVLIGESDSAPLLHLATVLGIAANLQFAVSDDMGWYYAAADIYVSTSITEAFGLANLEAVIMGLPALCTAVGGVPEVVGSGAWLIPAHDPDALVTALHTLVTDGYARQQWQQRARQWTARWPLVSTVTEAYIAMYQGQGLPQQSPSISGIEETRSDVVKLPTLWTTWHQQVAQWPLCPLPPVLTLPDHGKILMIAPHPDDEVLGCGGTLALLRQRGCQVKVVIVTDGSQGDPCGYLAGESVSACRQRESLAALSILGIDDAVFWYEPDAQYRHSAASAARFQALLDDYAADWLILPSVLDYHRDHVAISLSALEIWQQRGCRERVFFYETWAAIPANWVVDISSVFHLKQQATRCHELPLKYCDYLKACTGMANYRGLYLVEQPGQFAEAFLELSAINWSETVAQLLAMRLPGAI